MSDSECGKDCPLCMEPFELDDLNFFPCHCKYQICRFCWHRIKNGDSALCPACRQPYPEDPVKFKPMTEDDLQTMKMKKKEKEVQRRKRITDNRKHLSQIRVLQKNLVFVVGLPLYLDEVEKLKSVEYFGQYGKVVKVVANNSSAYAGTQAPSLSAYVTYSKMEEALQSVQGVNNVQIDGRTLKASLGTTKYCSTYLKNQQCHKTDCMYLHELADPEASFTKEDMQAQKHQEYERKLMRQMIQRNEESADLAKNSELKSSEETRCSSAPTVKSMLMASASSLTSSSANKGDGGDSSVTSSVDHAWSGGGGGASSGTPTTMMMLMHGGDDMKDPFDDTSSVHYDDAPPPPMTIESETFTASTTTASPPSGQLQQQSGGFPVVKSSSFTDSLALGTSLIAATTLSSVVVQPPPPPSVVGAVGGVVGDSELLSPHPFLCDPPPPSASVDYYDYNSTQQHQRLHKNPGAVGDDFTGRSLLHNTHPLGLSRGIPQQSLGGGVLDEQRENCNRLDRLDRLDYLPSSPFTSSTTSNRNNDFSNEILFDSFNTSVNPSSLYSSGLVRSAAPGSESRCLSDTRPPGPVGGPGPIGSAVGIGAIGTPSTTLIEDNNLLNSVWPSSLSRSSHDFIGSGRNSNKQQQQQQYNGWPITNNCNNKTPPSPSPFFSHHNTQRDVIGSGMGMGIGQPPPPQHTSQQHKDEDDLDFDVFAEGNKEFADIKSTVNHMSFDSSRGFGPGLLGFSDLGHHTHVGAMSHHNKHFQSPHHPLHTPHNFAVPGQQQHITPLGGHLTDEYSSNQFTQDTSEDRRNLFKRLLPPSVKVKFTATEATPTQQQQQVIRAAPKSRFASYMSNQQQQQQDSPTEHSSIYNNSGFGWQSSLPLQMSNMGLGGAATVDSPRNNGVGFSSYKSADNFTTTTSSAVCPPPGLIGSAASSASPYDPAIIASGLPSTHRQQQQQAPDSNMSLYSMMQQHESEPHWMKSLHKLTDINDHGGSAAAVASSSSSGGTAPLLVNNMNNNNLHMQQQQHSWMTSSSSQNKSTSAADPFATTGGNPPPGFR